MATLSTPLPRYTGGGAGVPGTGTLVFVGNNDTGAVNPIGGLDLRDVKFRGLYSAAVYPAADPLTVTWTLASATWLDKVDIVRVRSGPTDLYGVV